METTLTTSGGEWGGGYGTEFCDLQQTLGDVKAYIGQGNYDLQTSVGETKARIEKSIGEAHASLMGRVGDAERAVSKDVTYFGSQNLTKTGDAECAIIDRMGVYAADDIKNQADIEGRQALADSLQTKVITDQSATQALNNAIALKDLNDKAAGITAKMTDFERDIQNRIHENRFFLTKEIHDQADRVDDHMRQSFYEVNNALAGCKADVCDLAKQSAREFADLRFTTTQQIADLKYVGAQQYGDLKFEGLKNTSTILEKMGADKYDNMKDKIDALRDEKEFHRGNYNLALQNAEISSLKNMLNSVEQTQRFGSKTVQFGTGNLAGTAQTANQG